MQLVSRKKASIFYASLAFAAIFIRACTCLFWNTQLLPWWHLWPFSCWPLDSQTDKVIYSVLLFLWAELCMFGSIIWHFCSAIHQQNSPLSSGSSAEWLTPAQPSGCNWPLDRSHMSPYLGWQLWLAGSWILYWTPKKIWPKKLIQNQKTLTWSCATQLYGGGIALGAALVWSRNNDIICWCYLNAHVLLLDLPRFHVFWIFNVSRLQSSHLCHSLLGGCLAQFLNFAEAIQWKGIFFNSDSLLQLAPFKPTLLDPLIQC